MMQEEQVKLLLSYEELIPAMRQALMDYSAGCGKHGKTIKLFSHPSHSPWKSLRDSHIPHGHDCC